jgi:hypothetical protein
MMTSRLTNVSVLSIIYLTYRLQIHATGPKLDTN